jgi:hypothetical protein
MYLCISAQGCVCNWPCSCWLGTQIIKNWAELLLLLLLLLLLFTLSAMGFYPVAVVLYVLNVLKIINVFYLLTILIWGHKSRCLPRWLNTSRNTTKQVHWSHGRPYSKVLQIGIAPTAPQGSCGRDKSGRILTWRWWLSSVPRWPWNIWFLYRTSASGREEGRLYIEILFTQMSNNNT